MALDRDKIAEIKANINIVDLIAEVTPLTKAGRHFLGLCPFHKEKTPSFNVVEDKQFYHCFGCGKSGDAFKFLEEYRQITFLEAAAILAERAGVPVGPLPSQRPTSSKSPHQSLYDINQDAAKFYHAVLMTTTQGQAAKAYLASRGLDDELLAYFKIGLAPDEADYLYQSLSPKYDADTLTQSGLFNLSESNRFFDTFKDRIMFPLLDENGRTIGFSGRIWRDNGGADQQAKYKNTRSTPIFNKSAELYHLDKAKGVAKKTKELYLMEGFMDVIAAYRAGVTNAVATMGTALTPDHTKRLKAYANKLILTYDGDAAGQNAIAKSLDLLNQFQVDIVRFPDQMDPDDYLKQHSPEALASFLTQARISKVEFYASYYLPTHLDNLQAEIAYVDQMAQLIAQEPSITAQQSYCQLVADYLPDFDYFMVEQAVDRLRRQARGQEAPQALPQSWSVLPAGQIQSGGLLRCERQIFYRLLTQPQLLQTAGIEEFSFFNQDLDHLFRIVLREELSPDVLSQLPDQVSRAYYDVLSEHFPTEMADGEWEDLLRWRDRHLSQQELSQHQKAIREHSKLGDLTKAEDALAALIAQKRQLE